MYTADPYNVNLNNLANRIPNSSDNANAWGYVYGVDLGTVSMGARELAKNNPDVSWEKAFKRNYGIDINFFDDRLSTTFEYYREHRWDILVRDGTAPGTVSYTHLSMIAFASGCRVNVIPFSPFLLLRVL